jgi:hypothetical protein
MATVAGVDQHSASNFLVLALLSLKSDWESAGCR